MNKKLFVGNISYDSSEEKLEEVFSEFGTVESVNIITDNKTGRSRGFGFVEMSSEEEAEKAKEELDEKEVDGRNIAVEEAKSEK